MHFFLCASRDEYSKGALCSRPCGNFEPPVYRRRSFGGQGCKREYNTAILSARCLFLASGCTYEQLGAPAFVQRVLRHSSAMLQLDVWGGEGGGERLCKYFLNCLFYPKKVSDRHSSIQRVKSVKLVHISLTHLLMMFFLLYNLSFLINRI